MHPADSARLQLSRPFSAAGGFSKVDVNSNDEGLEGVRKALEDKVRPSNLADAMIVAPTIAGIVPNISSKFPFPNLAKCRSATRWEGP